MMELFTDNKYRRWYFQICDRARGRNSGDERHHVLPKSIGGGNDPANMVLLTYREHFLAHWLLTKFTVGDARRKMNGALGMMRRSNVDRRMGCVRILSSWQYERARRAHVEWSRGRKVSEATRARLRERTFTLEHRANMSAARKGHENSEVTRQRISASSKGVKKGGAHRRNISDALKGRPKSESHRANLRLHSPSPEHRKAISEKLKGRTYTQETIERMRIASTGRVKSAETRAKLSAALTGRVFGDEWRAKIGAAQKGVKRGPHSPEHRAKISAAAMKRARDASGRWGSKA